MHPEPQTLVEHLHGDLAPFVREHKGTLSVAADPFHFLELLAEAAPQGWRLALHWQGDENVAGDQVPVAILKNEFHVGVVAHHGLSAKPGEALMKKRAGGGPSLLRLVRLVRGRVRSLVWPEHTGGTAMYLGCEPVVLPDGTPLQGYRLRFSLMSADEPVTPRG